ncbi:MAG: DNA translocase FtsK 4TM domain-containing protein [Ignavibacteria bacterium]|nr:DNA translocase FtsK 4TM domain-containing protein [Ignavibacteria bacterium]
MKKKRTSFSSDKKRKFEDGLPLSVKKQILGFFLILSGILLSLSIITYSSADQSIYESTSWREIFISETKTQAIHTENLLGLAGVKISGFLVEKTFGYFSLTLPLIFILTGLQLIRKKNVSDLIAPVSYMLALMILSATFVSKLRISLGEEIISQVVGGISGEYFATVLSVILGSFATYVLLTLLILTFIYVLIDRDIVKSLARLKVWFESLKERLKTSAEELRQKRADEKYITSRKEKRKEIIRKPEEPEPVIKEAHIIRPDSDAAFGTSGKVSSVVSETTEPVSGNEISDEEEIVTNRIIEDESTSEETAEGEFNEYEYLEDFRMPHLELLDEPLKEELELISDEELNENSKLLQAKLLNFGVKIQKVIATPGPVVTLYEIVPEENIKLSRIESLEDDIALAMKARGIRMIIPMPGKGTVGVEIPNHKSVTVRIRGVLASRKFLDSKMQLPIALGKTISGEVYVDDLARMPHLLVAGSTGSGKSVGINTIITSLLYKLRPEDLKFVLIDPKKIELNLYDKLRNHYLAVSKDYNEKIITVAQNAVLALKGLEIEMEKRYERLANAAVRNIYDYNKKVSEGKVKNDGEIRHSRMPYIVVIIDELADLMITASREVEEPIARLAQLARAVGIHLILATQRPSVDVITGVIKANFPSRIAYLVNSKVDSRTILDMNGAEQLLGMGDMLYLPPGIGKPIRIQSPFISSEEVEKIAEFIGSQKGFYKPYHIPSVNQKKKGAYSASDERDELFEEAARIIVRYQRGSVSLLQRKLKIGYSRAARIVDELEAANIVGPNNGSKEREVLVDSEAQLEQLL